MYRSALRLEQASGILKGRGLGKVGLVQTALPEHFLQAGHFRGGSVVCMGHSVLINAELKWIRWCSPHVTHQDWEK